jgi:hypothetical protein
MARAILLAALSREEGHVPAAVGRQIFLNIRLPAATVRDKIVYGRQPQALGTREVCGNPTRHLCLSGVEVQATIADNLSRALVHSTFTAGTVLRRRARRRVGPWRFRSSSALIGVTPGRRALGAAGVGRPRGRRAVWPASRPAALFVSPTVSNDWESSFRARADDLCKVHRRAKTGG